MTPHQLIEWEPVLRSEVAVSLLLLAALLGAMGWAYMLYRENQKLHAWIREHLQAEADFSAVIGHVREAMSLRKETTP